MQESRRQAIFQPHIAPIAGLLCRVGLPRRRSKGPMTIRIAYLAGLLSLAGCATGGPKLDLGLGQSEAASKGRIAATIIASMNGGLIGGQLGSGLDERDRRAALEAEYRALEYTPNGQRVTWRGERSGVSGEVAAAQPYRVGSQDCRQYTHTVYSGGGQKSARGTACRNPNGSWTPLT